MKTYFHYWRLGWVAFVTIVLSVLGVNVLARGAMLLVGVDASDDFIRQVTVAAPVFLLVGLPYIGWVFQLGIKKSAVLAVPPSNSVSTPSDE